MDVSYRDWWPICRPVSSLLSSSAALQWQAVYSVTPIRHRHARRSTLVARKIGFKTWKRSEGPEIAGRVAVVDVPRGVSRHQMDEKIVWNVASRERGSFGHVTYSMTSRPAIDTCRRRHWHPVAASSLWRHFWFTRVPISAMSSWRFSRNVCTTAPDIQISHKINVFFGLCRNIFSRFLLSYATSHVAVNGLTECVV